MAMKQKIEITAEDKTKAAARSVKKSFNSVEKTGKSMGSGITSSMLGVVGGLTSIALAATALNSIIRTTANFEKLEASLRTVTGSAKAAEQAMTDIQSFVTELPSTVSELTESFIKLKALGLDPSERAIKSYSNTASAMGKSLNQMIEAVADAATGEFERLKEFGIKAKSEGENVSFTFQGVTTKIGKNAKEIQEFLLGIGEVQFAGAAAEQMDTINGATSNFQVAVDNLAVALGESGLGAAFKGTTNAVTDFLTSLTKGIVEDPIIEAAKSAAIAKVAFDDAKKSFQLSQKAADDGVSAWGKFGETAAVIANRQAVLDADALAAKMLMIEAEKSLNVARQKTLDIKGEIGDDGQAEFEAEFDRIVEAAELEESLQAEIDAAKQQAAALHFGIMHQIESEAALAAEKLRKSDAKKHNKEVANDMKGLISMVRAGNKSVTELARNAAIEKAKIYAKEAIIGAYNWGAGVGGPIMGAAAAATASVAVGALISALKGGGEGAGAPASNISSVPDTAAPIPVTQADARTQEVSIVVSGGLHSDEDVRNLIETIEEVRKDMGGNMSFVTS